MCGIFGVIDAGRLEARAPWDELHLSRFDALLDAMAHRGPDQRGVWPQPGILLGHRRLSILDLSDLGRQPMVSPAGTVLVFNGEIYNYVELREELGSTDERASSGDTYVLLAALDRWGLDGTLGRIRGMFAFAAWHPTTAELWLARDPVGKKPLYHGRHGEQLVFGSTVEAVAGWLYSAGMRLSVDPVALNHALACGWVPSPRTGLAEVRKLEPGTSMVLAFPGADGATRKYWSIPFSAPGARLDHARLEQLGRHLDTAISRRLRSDRPVATLLSGGLDSSLVTALAARRSSSLVAYTVRTHAGDNEEFELARSLAAHLGVEQRVLELQPDSIDALDGIVSHFGEPFCDSSAVPTAAIFREASREHRVVLTGDGGDEVQGGYTGARLFALRHLLWASDRRGGNAGCVLRRHAAEALDDPVRRLRGGLASPRFRLLRALAPARQALVVRDDGLDLADELFRREHREALGRDLWRSWAADLAGSLDGRNVLDRHLGFDFGVYLADDLNPKVDVCSMAHSVEARAPLLDLDFVTASWAVRSIDRVRPWARKRIVRKLAERVLPGHLLIRSKHGFAPPVRSLLRSEPGSVRLRAALDDPHDWLDELLDYDRIRAICRENEERGRYPQALYWRLVVIDAWARWAARLSRAS